MWLRSQRSGGGAWPQWWAAAQVLWGECISGALYINDFLALAREAGFADPRQLQVSAPVPLRIPSTVFQFLLYR